MKSKRDWEAIERDYRAGVVSIREVARRHDISESAIRQRASRDGWERDLTEKVRERVRSKLLRTGMRKTDGKEAEIIEEAATQQVAALALMRQDIANLRELEQTTMAQVETGTKLFITQHKGKIVEKVVALTATEKAIAAANLATVQHKRIQLERQARGMQDKATDTEIEIRVVYEDGRADATED